MRKFTSDWKKYLYDRSIGISFCPECGRETLRLENHYFPDRDSYKCIECDIVFTSIVPGEIIVTSQ
jgi:transposase-like protein